MHLSHVASLISAVLAITSAHPLIQRDENTTMPSTAGFTNATIHRSVGGAAICVSGYVAITASTSQGHNFNFQLPTTESELIGFWTDYNSMGSPLPEGVLGSNKTVGGDYNIYATLCMPPDSKPDKVQFLTHGYWVQGSYWDFTPGYSYVDYFTKLGYATFFYDRLSVGHSANPPSLDVQAPLEVEVLHQLATKLRSGAFGDVTFAKYIGVGHSYGSILTQSSTALYPDLFDGLILTGFSVYSGAMPTTMLAMNVQFATLNDPYSFGGVGKGYFVTGSVEAFQTTFFRSPGFNGNVLSLAYEEKGTVTFGEMFTTAAVAMPAMGFEKPVAVVDGAEDFIFCFGNCSYPTNRAEDVFAKLYPDVPKNKTGNHLAPTTGHAVNLHYSADESYDYIRQFLESNGL